MQILHGDAVLDNSQVGIWQILFHGKFEVFRIMLFYPSNLMQVYILFILQGCTILSGDVIVRKLAHVVKPSFVVFLVS